MGRGQNPVVSYLDATDVVKLMYESELWCAHPSVACLQGVMNLWPQRCPWRKGMDNPTPVG